MNHIIFLQMINNSELTEQWQQMLNGHAAPRWTLWKVKFLNYGI